MNRNYKKYRNYVIDNFNKFLSGEITNYELNDKLHVIQEELGYSRQRIHKCVHFRFDKEDNYSYRINTIWSDIEFGEGERRSDMMAKLKFAINNPRELQIFYC